MLLLALQNDRSSADLIGELTRTGITSPHALEQMYALYDGTKQSLQTTPDISLFSNKVSGVPLSCRTSCQECALVQHCVAAYHGSRISSASFSVSLHLSNSGQVYESQPAGLCKSCFRTFRCLLSYLECLQSPLDDDHDICEHL